MVSAFIGLGSNLQGPEEQVRHALRQLPDLAETRLVAASSLYDTPPWGDENQPAFVNAVAQVDTTLSAGALLTSLQHLERAAGRVRHLRRWGPRILDLDLLVYGRDEIDEPGLRVPHPRLAERAFVLVPLHEIAPDLDVPGKGPVTQLLADCEGVADVRRLTPCS